VIYVEEITVIRVSKETRAILRNLGKKGESYDAIIRRLIEYYDQGNKAAMALERAWSGEIKRGKED
jgi:hypothetical protein